MKSMRSSILVAVVVLAVLTVAGCSDPKTTRVSGSVTYDGKPLPSGTITFVSEKGGQASGVIDNGKYVLPQVSIGPVSITVVTEPPPPQQLRSADGKPIGASPQSYVAIPARYATVEKSDLKATVIKGEQTIPIELKP